MPTTSSTDSVSMEFVGPVPSVLGSQAGYHAVIRVHAAGGASFTRPSEEERNYYAETGKTAPEWQCEYFEFDGVMWPEAALTVELWHGSAKLRSLCAAARAGRTEIELRSELPELGHFLQKHGLSLSNLTGALHDSLLHTAETAGVIKRGIIADAAPATVPSGEANHVEAPSWYRALLLAWSHHRAARGSARRTRMGSEHWMPASPAKRKFV